MSERGCVHVCACVCARARAWVFVDVCLDLHIAACAAYFGSPYTDRLAERNSPTMCTIVWCAAEATIWCQVPQNPCERERERGGEKERVCACMCVCVCVFVCVCVCVCVCMCVRAVLVCLIFGLHSSILQNLELSQKIRVWRCENNRATMCFFVLVSQTKIRDHSNLKILYLLSMRPTNMWKRKRHGASFYRMTRRIQLLETRVCWGSMPF